MHRYTILGKGDSSYLVDKISNNVVSMGRRGLTYDQAVHELKSLVDCERCWDCRDCVRCKRCTGCVGVVDGRDLKMEVK